MFLNVSHIVENWGYMNLERKNIKQSKFEERGVW